MSNDEIKLTPLQKEVLLALFDPKTRSSHKLKVGEIAKQLDIPMKEMASLVTFLESTGYIEKCGKSSPVE